MGPLGTLLVLVGLGFAAFGTVTGIGATLAGHPLAGRITRIAAWGFSLALIGANAVMVAALLMHDFSVQYVAQVGSRATPTLFTIVSLWSALEGSILFWGAILGGFVIAFMIYAKDVSSRFFTLSIGSMMAVSCFFGFLIVGPANPFAPTPLPIPLDGPGPNPYLQNHILMIVHPPALYLGYVGMTIPFGLAVGGLIDGKLPEGFGQMLRRWTLVPWLFLTAGIVLGGWWAYEVLGWGGYWAWDPVENASLLPWLTATAFIHSSMVHERRRGLRMWTLSLVLTSFWLTILGTFMTRSGIFNSVHAFTQSSIGPMFLVFLAVILVVSVTLMVVGGGRLAQDERGAGAVSRDTAVLVTNLVLAAFAFTVFLGTVLPLIVEALEGKRISVGEPYFNKFGIPLSMMILFLMGVGPALPWGSTDARSALRRLAAPFAAFAVVIVGCLALGLRGVPALLTFGLAGLATVVTLRELFLPVVQRRLERGEPLGQAFVQGLFNARRRTGAHLVHLAVIATAVGIAASSTYVTSVSGTVKKGQSFQLGAHTIRFDGMQQGREPHRSWIAATMVVEDQPQMETLLPRLNYYERSKDPIGTPAVRSVRGRDVYLSLMAAEEDGSASYRGWLFPMVGWIWWSLPLFFLGTTLSVWPSRRRAAATAAAAAPAVTPSMSGGAT